jgi:hypothetical protein
VSLQNNCVNATTPATLRLKRKTRFSLQASAHYFVG